MSHDRLTFQYCGAFCFVLALFLSGCGTSKLTNTTRTATEQLLLTDAMDRAVSQVNLSVLSGKKVYVNAVAVEDIQDAAYLVSIVRQHALASGCLLQDEEEKADIILELHAGSSGTDQHDTMFGISEMTIPGFGNYTATTVPEIAVAKRVIQKATIKIGVFAYTREGRRPIYQSGNLVAESKAKNRWLLGIGPYQTGDIYEQPMMGEQNVTIPLIDLSENAEEEFISVGSPAFFRQNFESESKAKAEAKTKAEEATKVTEEAKGDANKVSSATPAPVTVQPTPAVGAAVTLPDAQTLPVSTAQTAQTAITTEGGLGLLSPSSISAK